MASPASAPHADVLGERGKALARSLQAVLADVPTSCFARRASDAEAECLLREGWEPEND